MKSNFLVNDVMLKDGLFPKVDQNEMMKETLIEMDKFGLGIACLVDKANNLIGVITDGDIRRIILNVNKPMAAIFVDDVQIYSTTNFAKVNPETPLQKAVLIMEQLKIWDLPVVDKSGNLVGLLHLHPAIKLLLGV